MRRAGSGLEPDLGREMVRVRVPEVAAQDQVVVVALDEVVGLVDRMAISSHLRMAISNVAPLRTVRRQRWPKTIQAASS